MECIKIVKEYEMKIGEDVDVIFTEDLPIRVRCICIKKDADHYELKFSILSADAGVDKYSVIAAVKVEGKFTDKRVSRGWNDFKCEWFPIVESSNVLEFSEKMNEISMDLDIGIGKKEYICRGTFRNKVKIIFTLILPKKSVLPLIGYDFTDKNEANDTILVVGGQNFHVNKAVLSLYSPFFNSLFNNKHFEEANKNEIELKDLDVKEFEVLLQVIHPTNTVVNANNVEFLWKLSDRFCITSVAKMCESFICNLEGKQTGAFSVSNRLKMAEMYNSKKLKAIVMNMIDNM